MDSRLILAALKGDFLILRNRENIRVFYKECVG